MGYFKGLGIFFKDLLGIKECDPYKEHIKIKDSGGCYLSNIDLKDIIKEQLGEKLSKDAYFFLLDTMYYLPSIQYVQDIIRIDTIDTLKYKPDAFDCDDFAYILNTIFINLTYKNEKRRSPFSFGIIFGFLPNSHAINIFVDDKKKVYLIEPQSDKLIEISDEKIKSIFYMVM